MKKLLFLFASLLLVSCSKDDSTSTHYIKVVNPYSRVTFNQISLAGYSFSFDNPNEETFTLDNGMPNGLNDIRVSLQGRCSVQNRLVSIDILVNFIEGNITTLTVDSIITCSPQIIVSYE